MNATTEHNSAFEQVRSQLAADMQPVRPFAATRWMAAFVMLFSVATAGYLWRSFSWRDDQDVLGGWWLWGLSGVELLVAFVLLACVLREAVPGRSPSLTTLALGGVGAVGCHVVVSVAMLAKHPVPVPEGMDWMYGVYCFRYEVALGVPCFLFALWLSTRGLTSRPLRVGILGGVGAGLTADAIWRLFCPYNEPAHSFGSHTLGILAVLIVGLLCTACWDALRLRAWRQRADSRE